MVQDEGAGPCPGCGAPVHTKYCPHCGSRTVLADEPMGAGRHGSVGLDPPTVRTAPVDAELDGPAKAVPEMFQTELVQLPPAAQAEAWSQDQEQRVDPAGPPSGLFPGWTGMYPVVATPGAGGALAPRRERRRRALYAVA